MLLNLSNHPSANWSEKQRLKAIELYTVIEDLQFPPISPTLKPADLDLLVDNYIITIRKINPMAIHIMGEMTFTFRLVNQLKAIGFTCIASTTERKSIEENGIKTSIFEFIQFREY
jgi:hypothetical protein